MPLIFNYTYLRWRSMAQLYCIDPFMISRMNKQNASRCQCDSLWFALFSCFAFFFLGVSSSLLGWTMVQSGFSHGEECRTCIVCLCDPCAVPKKSVGITNAWRKHLGDWWLQAWDIYSWISFTQNAHCMIYTHLSMNLSIDWSIDRSIHPSIYLSIYLPTSLPACLPAYRIYLSILFYSIRFYSVLFYSILFCSIVFYCALFYSILFYPNPILNLFYSILFCSILFISVLFYSNSILFYSTLFYSILLYSSLI